MKPIALDTSGRPEQPTLVLGTQYGNKIGMLTGASAWHYHPSFAGTDEISFDVYKFVEGKLNPLWHRITDFKSVWYKEVDTWFQIVVTLEDTDATVKHCEGVAIAESELSQTKIYDIEINTESDILNDDYTVTKFYNPTNVKGSLLNRILYKNQNYKIAHVDTSLRNIQRTFSWSDTTTYDAFQDIAKEIGCLFVFGSGTNSSGEIERTVSAYDLYSYCTSCGKRSEGLIKTCPNCGSSSLRPPYGIESNIIVSRDNLTDKATFTTDTGSVKNCFRLIAGDDLMTAAVRSVMPSGDGYLWYLNEETLADMTPQLQSRIRSYNSLSDTYNTTRNFSVGGLVTPYNTLINKYAGASTDYRRIHNGSDSSSYENDIVLKGFPSVVDAYYTSLDFYYYLHDSMMPGYKAPSLNAEQQAAKLKQGLSSGVSLLNITSATTAETVAPSIRSMARLYIDYDIYSVNVNNTSWDVVSSDVLDGNGNPVTNSDGSVQKSYTGTWIGTLQLINRKDDEDTASTGMMTIVFENNEQEYINQRLEKKIDEYKNEAYNISGLFDMQLGAFKQALRNYSYSCLSEFYACCEACVDILIDQGLGEEGTKFIGGVNWAGHDEMYTPWYNKLTAIQDELTLRGNEVATVQSMVDALQNVMDDVHNALDFSKYIGEDLWKEFIVYRREDSYTNNNFISDGLSNAEVINYARQFLEQAEREIYKSAMLQHSITANLHNLLVIPEFAHLADQFAPGLWIRILVDDEPYKLRLLEYEIDWDNLDEINVKFSDVTKIQDGISDVQSILASAKSMATSYSETIRKAETGNLAGRTMEQWIQDGLALTNKKIISSATDQSMTIDSSGLYMRRMDVVSEEYDLEQVKLINTTLAFTNDGWKTVHTALGKYIDGDGNVRFGLIGNTIIGELFAGANLVITNLADDGSTLLFRVDKNGAYMRNGTFALVNSNMGGIMLDPTKGMVAGAQNIFSEQDGKVSLSLTNIVSGGVLSNNANFYMDLNGNVYMRGTIYASSGNIGGLTINNNSITAGSASGSAGGLTLQSNGNFRLGNSTNYISYNGTTLALRTNDSFRLGGSNCYITYTKSTDTLNINASSINIGGGDGLWSREEIENIASGVASNLDTTVANNANLYVDNKIGALVLSTSTNSKTATITLYDGTTSITSGSINFNGLVSFTDLASSSGTTTINGSNITTGTIDANRIKLYGDMAVYNGASSSTIGGYIGYGAGRTGGQTTNGIHMYYGSGNNIASETICTSAGVRMSTTSGSGNGFLSFYIAGDNHGNSAHLTAGTSETANLYIDNGDIFVYDSNGVAHSLKAYMGIT